MKKICYLLLTAFALQLSFTGCKKKDDTPAATTTTSSTQQSISKKWMVGDKSGRIAVTDYLFFEFTASNRYIVFKKNGSTVYGNYTMSADQKTITMDNFGVITITSVDPNNFTFTLTLTGSTTPITIFSTVVASVASSPKTDLLCRGWKISKITLNGTSTTYPNSTTTKFETIFSKAGTYFTTQVSSGTTVSNPQQWQWKDSNETFICYGVVSSTCTGENAVEVNELTATSMKITETHISLGVTTSAVYELSPL